MDSRGTLQVASGAMLVAVTAALAASVTFVAFSFGDAPSAALVIGKHDERLDEWVAVHVQANGEELMWHGSEPGVRYAVDKVAHRASPWLDTEPTPMPVGRSYHFCADGPQEVQGWSFSITADGQLVSVVSFAVIMPCD